MARLTREELRRLPLPELEEALSRTSYFANRQNWELLRLELNRRRQPPEWKTAAFWLALLGILLASLALARDYCGWDAKDPRTHAAPPPAPTPPPLSPAPGK